MPNAQELEYRQTKNLTDLKLLTAVYVKYKVIFFLSCGFIISPILGWRLENIII